MEKLNRAQKMLNFGASKPRVKGGPGPPGPPLDPHLIFMVYFLFVSNILTFQWILGVLLLLAVN